MSIKSKQLYILIGNDNTGKTIVQKLLIEKICNQRYGRLPTNLRFNILHPEIKRKYENISFGNRSFQEKIEEYHTVDEYFQNHFNPADISIISSHLHPGNLADMIRNGKERFYNVTGVFFTNSIALNTQINSQLSLLDWDEKLIIENEVIDDNENQRIERQLNTIADNFVIFISSRTAVS